VACGEQLIGADDLEGLVDEDVVRPVDSVALFAFVPLTIVPDPWLQFPGILTDLL
jgi:hypothetical protein